MISSEESDSFFSPDNLLPNDMNLALSMPSDQNLDSVSCSLFASGLSSYRNTNNGQLQSSANDCLQSMQYLQAFETSGAGVASGLITASPHPPSSTCGSLTPITTQSYISDISPMSQAIADTAMNNIHLTSSHPASVHFSSTPVTPAPEHLELKTDKPKPPKKPLTPYMRFSKSIWQKVKAANPNLSVCEVGATIGRMWRELTDIDKQGYNVDFANDKARYDGELQNYLQINGLQPSDLVKPKAKKTPKEKSQGSSRGHSKQLSSHTSVPPEFDSMVQSHQLDMSSSFNGDVLGQTGLQGTTSEDMEDVIGSLSQFPYPWLGQDAFTNQQMMVAPLAGSAKGQSAYSNQDHFVNQLFNHQQTDVGNVKTAPSTGERVNDVSSIEAMLAIQSENEMRRMADIYNCNSDPIPPTRKQHPNSQDTSNFNDTIGLSSNNDWLWQQYAAGNQFGQEAVTQSNGVHATESLQKNSQGPMSQSSLGSQLNEFDPTLEPGEVQLSKSPAVQAGLPSADWNQIESSRLPTDTEKLMLRDALVEKVDEIQRLMKELEQAYRLINQLKQQNDFYHLHWNQLQQDLLLTSLKKNAAACMESVKSENNVGL